MKVYFDNVSWDAEHTGPNCFAKRLAVQLGNMGHQLADPDDYDIALVFIEPTNKLDLKKPFIQRLDGIWFKPDQMATGMNCGIHAAYDKAASVVWQSEFDKQMTQRWFGERKGVVISNGIEIKRAAVRSEQLIDMRATFDKIFVCSANWHPQKRLRDNVEVFRRLRDTQFPNSCLVVLGSNPDYHVADKGVFYAGSIRHDLCAEVYAVADWMIHMAWLDHCPNVVVEAIAQGCPVLCSSEGGTKELVSRGNNGRVIADAEPYDCTLSDYDDPPRVPLDKLPKLPAMRAQPYTVDIVECAKKYEEALFAALRV
jgi:glycosyltransferase involved in cell wall biosynthesis